MRFLLKPCCRRACTTAPSTGRCFCSTEMCVLASFVRLFAAALFPTPVYPLQDGTVGIPFDPAYPHNAAARVPALLHCLSVVHTKRVAGVRRGAVVRALAVCSPYQFVDQLQGALHAALDSHFESDDDGMLARLFDSINAVDLSTVPRLTRCVCVCLSLCLYLSVPVSVHVPVFLSILHPRLASHLLGLCFRCAAWPAWHRLDRTVMRGTIPLPAKSLGAALPTASPTVALAHKVQLAWNGATYPLRAPLCSEADAVAGASLVRLCMRFNDRLMDIYDAVLREKRVLFFGDKSECAGDVASCVLAACLLVAPPLSGVIRRAFPYTSLTNLEFLEVPGYIAGVTNPMVRGRLCRGCSLRPLTDVLCRSVCKQSRVVGRAVRCGDGRSACGGSGRAAWNGAVPSAVFLWLQHSIGAPPVVVGRVPRQHAHRFWCGKHAGFGTTVPDTRLRRRQ